MHPAIIYFRFSTAKQEQGSSQDRQLQAARDMIAKHGWLETEVIADVGVSAWKGDHLRKGNLGKLRKRIDDGDIAIGTIIVCEEIDRLGRQKARQTRQWIEEVCKAGVSIATTATGKIYNDENLDANILNIMEILLKAEAAHEYSERLSRRVKASYEARLAKARIDNTPITSQGPAWLRLDGRDWRSISERVRIIREIFDLTRAGQAPWAIATLFNNRGDKSFTGKAWERTAVVKIVRNRAIEGDYVVGEGKQQKPTGEVLPGYYGAPVVPLDVIAEARAMLDRRQLRKGKGRNSGAVNNLFGQSVRCGVCDGRMMQCGYESRYLVCYEASRGNGCDHKAKFKYRNLESAVLDTVLPLALGERFFRQGQKSSTLSLEIAETEKEIRDRQAASERAFDFWDRSGSETAERRHLEAEAEVKRLKSVLADLNTKLSQAQGRATADQHLQRLVGVREALTHPQDEVRLPARLKVAEAMQAVGFRAVATGPGLHADDDPALFYIELGGETLDAEPMHTLWITNDGEVVADDPRPHHFVQSWAEVSPTAKRYLRNAERRKGRVGRDGEEAA